MAQPEIPASADAFAEHAADYDRLRRGLVPCFDAFYGAALERIEAWQRERASDQRALSVLDLGAGTGLFSALLQARFPGVRLHLFDASQPMLQQARGRLRAYRDVSFITGDLAHSDLGGVYDLVISALAIHHLEDAKKRGLFGRIHAALVAGGLFVNAEQILAPTPALERLYHAIWRRQAREHGVPKVEIENAEQRMRYDRCATLEAQMQWLAEAGFGEIDCCFKSWRFAVYSGIKPPQRVTPPAH